MKASRKQQDKQHGSEVEARLLAAGAVRERRTGLTLTLFGQPKPQFRPGDRVQVRVEDGSWRGGLRAVSGVEQGDAGDTVWVCWDEEWQAAQSEGREPAGAPWPYEQVEFWEPGWTLNEEEPTIAEAQSNEHEQVSILADMR